jgi:hypothetical protein
MCSELRHRKFSEFRFGVRAALGQRPWLYFALQHVRPSRRHLLVARDTEIVIEGYWCVKFVFVSSGRGTRSQNTAIYGIYELLYIAISHILGLTVQRPTYKIKVYKPLCLNYS